MPRSILKISFVTLFISGCVSSCFKPTGNGNSTEDPNSTSSVNSENTTINLTYPTSSNSEDIPTSTLDQPDSLTETTSTSDILESTSLELTISELTTSGLTTSEISTSESTTSSTSSSDSSTGISITPSTVFVTSAQFNGDFLIVSPDDHCKYAAELAGLNGIYRAWISFVGESAASRMSSIDGELIRLDGQIFSSSLQDLLKGNIINPLNITEYNEILNTDVWTGTDAKGMLTVLYNCADWQNETTRYTGYNGHSNSITSEWTFVEPRSTCEMLKSLYCFEVKLGI